MIGHIPGHMVSMEKFLRFFAERLTQEFGVQRLHIGVFVGEAHGVGPVQVVQFYCRQTGKLEAG